MGRGSPSVYGLRRWQRDGMWRRVVTGLQARADAAGVIIWDVSADSTIMRAHQHAAGARTRPETQVQPGAGRSCVKSLAWWPDLRGRGIPSDHPEQGLLGRQLA